MNFRINKVIGIWLLFAFAGILGCVSDARSYEVPTHEIMTEQIAQKSNIAASNFLEGLGLPSFGSNAYNINSNLVSAKFLMAFGANKEDNDYLIRVFNHFFDAQYNKGAGRGMNALFTGWPSPDWAIEDNAAISDKITGANQVLSLRDASSYYYLGSVAQSPSEQAAYYSLMFQSLGAVVHHIEDMGQPQHVRNDQHVHFDYGILHFNPAWANYERYFLRPEISAKIPDMMWCLNESAQKCPPYATKIPKFPMFRNFWKTNVPGLPGFSGLADFTSQNFMSYGTLFWSKNGALMPDADLPLPDGVGKRVESAAEGEVTGRGVTIPNVNKKQYVLGDVRDDFLGAHPALQGVRLAVQQGVRGFAVRNGAPGFEGVSTYSEDDNIFEDKARILLPRIASFGVGLINQFFGGKIDLARKVEGVAGDWVISNKGSDPISGVFQVVSEDASGNRVGVPGAQYTGSLAAGGSMVVSMNEPSASTKKLLIVFRGRIGAEGDSTLQSDYYRTAASTKVFYPAVACQGLSNGGRMSFSRQLNSAGGWNEFPIVMGTAAGNVTIDSTSSLQGTWHTWEVRSGNAARTLLLAYYYNGAYETTNRYFYHDPVATGSDSVIIREISTVSYSNGKYYNVQLSVGCPGVGY